MAKDINVKITGDSKDLERALGRARESGSRLSSGMKRIGVAAAIGFAAVGTAAAVGAKKAVDAASNLEESINAVNVTFGKAADRVLAFSKTAATQAGLSQRAFNQLATPVGAMLRNMGLGADQAADSTINLAKRAADMASVFNTDVADSMQAIQAGLRGEADPLERFGVSLNAAAVEAEAVKMGLIGAGQEMTAQQKTQARLSLLFKQTNRFAGDFVNTSDGLANSQRILKAQFENVTAEVGRALLPVATRLMELLARGLPPAIELVRRGIRFLQGVFGDLGERMEDSGVRAEGIRDTFMNVVGWIRTNLFPIFRQLGDIIATAVGRIARVIQEHRPELERIWRRVGAAIQLLWKIARPILRILFTEVLPRAIGIAITAMDKISGAWERVIRFFGDAYVKVRRIMTNIRDEVKSRIDRIVTFFRNLPGRAADAISSMASKVKGAITGLFGKVIDWAKGALGISSPSKVFEEIGKNVVRGFINGIGSMGGALKTAVLNIVKSIPGRLNPFGPGIGQGLVNVGRALQNAGFSVGEHPAFGGVAAVHTPGSYHYQGRAIDVNWPGGGATELTHLRAALAQLSGIPHKELMIEDAGRSNQHLHFAMARGGYIGEHVRGIGMRSGASYEFGERGGEYVIPRNRAGVPVVIHNILELDGEVVYRNQRRYAGRNAMRNG